MLAGATMVNETRFCPPGEVFSVEERRVRDIEEAHRNAKGKDHHRKTREEKLGPGLKVQPEQECGPSLLTKGKKD